MEQGFRRVVTGHDPAGRSIVVLDDTPASVTLGTAGDRRVLTEFWATVATGPGTAGAAAGFSEIRVVDMPAGSRRAMHRTDTVDYGIVLDGEVWMVLDVGETLLRAGDVVVQRGTNHAWQNRSGRPARMAFINLGGQTTDGTRCPPV
ncbi:MAG: cupin domain-containing protein [Alphaproteobacteria bacterium]|nr:cupin domain-containing protein [Alphaproteobacteria bacterium]